MTPIAALRLLALLLLSITMASNSLARDAADLDGTTEHPEVVRIPGFYIDNSKQHDFDEFAFVVKVGGTEKKAGRFWFVDYILKDGARQPSTVELIRNYENAFRRWGGSAVHRWATGAVFRTGSASAGERWAQIHVDEDGARYQLTIVDVAAMSQKLEFSASEMAQALKSKGSLTLHGVQFDTGRATLQPGSEELLSEVVVLLKAEPGLRLSIEGHTDNVGEPKANLALSQRRAETVVGFLTARGIDASRLRAVGKGDTVPVADNRTDTGRSKNRRVELVRL